MANISGKITCRESFGGKIFKSQGRYIATSSCKSRIIGICSFEGHISSEKHAAVFKCMDGTEKFPSRTSSTEHGIINEDDVTDLVVLGLPAFNVKGKPSENNGPKDVSENPNNLVKVSSPSALPIKLQPKTFKDTEFGFTHEKNSCNLLNAAERLDLPVKVKAEAPEEAEARVALERHGEKFSSFSQLRSKVNVYFSEATIKEKSLPHFSSFENNHNKLVTVPTQSPSPIKMESTSFEDTEFGFSHEKNSYSRLNASEPPDLPINVKNKTPEVAEASVVLEKYVEKLPNFSQLDRSFCFCFSEASIREKFFRHFSISKEIKSSKLSNEIHIPEDLHFQSAGYPSTILSDLDRSYSGITALLIPHADKVDICDCLLKGNVNVSETKDVGCFNQSSHLESKFYAGEPQSNPLSSIGSFKVKAETIHNSQTYLQIPPCNRGHMFEYKDLPNGFPLDILDHVTLKYRLGNSELSSDFPLDILNHIPLKYMKGTSELSRDFPLDILDNVPLKYRLGSTVSEVGVHFKSDSKLPSESSGSDLDRSYSGITGLLIPHAEKVDVVCECLLMGNGNASVTEDLGCFNQPSHLGSKFYAGEPQSNPLSSTDSFKVKAETMHSSQTCLQIPPCNREHMFEYKDLPSGFPLDILDHVPLKYRLGNSELSSDLPLDILNHVPLNYMKGTSELSIDLPLDILDNVPLKYRLGSTVSEVGVHAKSDNFEQIPSTPSGYDTFGSISSKTSLSSRRRKREIVSVTSGCGSFGSVNTKASISSRRSKKKKTATDSAERAMEEDAPGLLQILLDRGIQVEEIKLYGDFEDNDPLEETYSYEDNFEDLETLLIKLFCEHSSLLKFNSRLSVKRSGAVYCISSLIALIEQCRYLLFRQTPAEWGWCRDLRSFIFVFKTHNRIVLERPEYGYATYFFELVSSLPIDWQMKRLAIAMKLTNCSRTILLENKPLIVGEDISEGEALVLEAYGWVPNTGFGTLLNYCDRVVHDRRSETRNFDWRARIGRILMDGYDSGSSVLTSLPRKVAEYMGDQNPEINMEP